ncbi:MAG: carboxypeptidase-like regulatory domain-containing protein [Chitinispirillaceae bacterium]
MNTIIVKRLRGLLLLILLCVPLGYAQEYSISGIVTNTQGAPVEGALVTLVGQDNFTTTDASGQYMLNGTIATSVNHSFNRTLRRSVSISDKSIRFSLPQPSPVAVKIFSANGACVVDIPRKTLSAGIHDLGWINQLGTSQMYIVKITVGDKVTLTKYIPMGGTTTVALGEAHASGSGKLLAKSTQSFAELRASAAGYKSAACNVTNLRGIYDLTLDSTVTNEIGTPSQENGSSDRLAAWGNEQYFWGDRGNGDEPMVKIVTAESDEVVDMAVIFNPHFVDNTWGENKIGWKRHRFMDLVRSDHVELAIRNADGDTVFYGKLDLISARSDAPSGYATLGPNGGGEDGEVYAGSADKFLSFSTSTDENLNYYGYELFDDSPATDSIYTPNPDYPHWQYYVVYTISIRADAFGESGYGDVSMTSVHASPAKGEEETVEVSEGQPPSEEQDVFKHMMPEFPFSGTPPEDGSDNPGTNPPDDGTDTPVNPPDDGTDDPDNPPDDGTDDPDNPPDDGTDDPDNPPDDGTDDPDNPPDDGTDDPDNPPDDGTDDPDNPPDDGSDNPGTPPPDDGTDTPVNPPDDGTDDQDNPPDDGSDTTDTTPPDDEMEEGL